MKKKKLDLLGKVAWLESYHTVKNKLTDGVDLRKRFFKSVTGLLLIHTML